MCENCFMSEIKSFPDETSWTSFDLKLTTKLGQEKMKNTTFEHDEQRDKDDGQYIYECLTCEEKWKMKDPDNTFRGYFLKVSTLIFLTLLSLRVFGQTEDHLLPTENFFSLYKHEIEYYPYISKHLLKDLSDSPLARMITLPSFSPENVVSVESVDKDEKTFKVIFITGKESIWYKTNKNTLETTRYEETIDTSLVTIIKKVFKKATSQVRYMSDDSWAGGLDGVTYIFSAFAVGQGNRSGQVWSPDQGTKMNELVEFGDAMIQLAKSDNDNDRLKFKKEIKAKGERLLKGLNAQ